MSFETEGVLHKVFETENKTETFQAREFVIKQEGNYPQFIKFQLTQDRCDLVSKFKEGDKIKVSFDLRGREWNDRYFTNLNAWRIDTCAVNEESLATTKTTNTTFDPIDAPLVKSNEAQSLKAEDFEDLPF